MVDRSTCLSPFCGTRLFRRLVKCPDCGRPMYGDDDVGRRGRHILPLGLILASLLVASIWMLDLLPAVSGGSGTGFRGSETQAWLLLAGLGSLALTGIATIISGMLMIAGRSSRLSTIAMISLFAVGLVFVGLSLATVR